MTLSYVRGGGATSSIALHRLNYLQTLIWFGVLGRNPKQMLASNICKRYPYGTRICTESGAHVANVSPRGDIIDLPPPHHRFLGWQFDNNPTVNTCPCREYTDPENNGRPWSMRGSSEHHPLCQHDKTAIAVHKDVDRLGVQNPRIVAARPDLWIRAREHYRGR